jgi:virulence-associated protein VagC
VLDPAAPIAMSERDSDIEFDFFEDEPATTEAQARRPVRRGGRPPIRPPAGVTPLLRLVGLIAFAILVVVLLVFAVQSCRGSQKRDTYENYMDDTGEVASQSEQIGRRLNNLLTDPGAKLADIRQQLSGLAQQQEQGVAKAEDIEAPGALRDVHPAAVEALQLRVSGLRGLERAFGQTAQIRSSSTAGQALAAQARRLLASDVVWDDLFKEPSRTVLAEQDVRGVQVPDSNFLRDPDLATPRLMSAIWQRVRGASTGGRQCSPRGTGLISLKALPSGTELSTTTLNTVEASENLAFAVTIEDTGCSQEVRVPVTLTIQKQPTNIVKKQTVPIINPGERQTVTFREIGQVPFATRTSIKIEVEPVKGETRTSNNTAEYPVIFSLGT